MKLRGMVCFYESQLGSVSLYKWKDITKKNKKTGSNMIIYIFANILGNVHQKYARILSQIGPHKSLL